MGHIVTNMGLVFSFPLGAVIGMRLSRSSTYIGVLRRSHFPSRSCQEMGATRKRRRVGRCGQPAIPISGTPGGNEKDKTHVCLQCDPFAAEKHDRGTRQQAMGSTAPTMNWTLTQAAKPPRLATAPVRYALETAMAVARQGGRGAWHWSARVACRSGPADMRNPRVYNPPHSVCRACCAFEQCRTRRRASRGIALSET